MWEEAVGDSAAELLEQWRVANVIRRLAGLINFRKWFELDGWRLEAGGGDTWRQSQVRDCDSVFAASFFEPLQTRLGVGPLFA